MMGNASRVFALAVGGLLATWGLISVNACESTASAQDADRYPPMATPPTDGGSSSTPSPATMSKAYKRNACDEQLVLCVDVDGNLYNGGPGHNDDLPKPRVGDVLHVRVIGTKSSVAKQTLIVKTDATLEARKRVFSDVERKTSGADAGASSADGGDAGAKTTRTESEEEELLIEAQAIMPDAPSLQVRLQRLAEDGKEVVSEETIVVPLERRQPFHFEATLLVPIIPRGERNMTTGRRPGSGATYSYVEEDTRATVGLALNYFPGGICGNGPWTPGGDCGRRGKTEGTAPTALGAVRQYVLLPLGIQGGTTLDFSNRTFREWYLGIAFEAIRGASLSLGFAFVKGRFYRPGFSNGVVVDGLDVDAYSVEQTMIRPYFGLGISPEILGTVLNVLEQVKKIAPPGR